MCDFNIISKHYSKLFTYYKDSNYFVFWPFSFNDTIYTDNVIITLDIEFEKIIWHYYF